VPAAAIELLEQLEEAVVAGVEVRGEGGEGVFDGGEITGGGGGDSACGGGDSVHGMWY
jgi:hypothetical protein